MELSKRLAAALIAICMLLTCVPVFAGTVSAPNELMTLPADGSSVSLTVSTTGNANNCAGLVIKAGDEAKLGIDINKITSRIVLAGTDYEGLLLDGTFTIKSTNYKTDNSNEVSKVYANDELTHFQFADLEVKSFRKTGSGLLVIEVEPQKVVEAIVPGTAKKVKPEALTREANEEGIVALTEEDFVTLTDAEVDALTGQAGRVEAGGYDFTASGIAGYNIVISAKAGAAYTATKSVDTGVFPDGTIFISASKMNLNGATTSADWGYVAVSKTEAPEATFVAQAAGEYAVYALKTGYNSDGSRNSRARINGVDFAFTQADMPSELASVKGFYWQKDAYDKTVTLQKGELIVVNLRANQAYSRTAALALVPVSGAANVGSPMWAVKSSYPYDNLITQEQLEWLHDQTTVDFIVPPAITRTVNVNGTDYEVSSDEADAMFTVAGADFDNFAISDVTVLDALVKAGVINEENKSDYAKKIMVRLNGMQIYNLDKYVLTTGDVVTTSAIETVDVSTVQPTSIGANSLYSTLGSTGDDIKLCFSKKNMSASNIAFSYDEETETFIDNALQNAKVVGYMDVVSAITKSYTTGEYAGTSVVIPVGSKVYLINEYLTGKIITSGTHGFVMEGGMTVANEGSRPLHVVYPDGTIGHHPYYIQNSGYNWDNVYVMNSQTTNAVKARFVESTGRWQVYTDGGKYVCVLKYRVDENGKYESFVSMKDEYILFNDPLGIELKDNERAVVWGYLPYAGAGTGGTTMIPLTQTLANPAN